MFTLLLFALSGLLIALVIYSLAGYVTGNPTPGWPTIIVAACVSASFVPLWFHILQPRLFPAPVRSKHDILGQPEGWTGEGYVNSERRYHSAEVYYAMQVDTHSHEVVTKCSARLPAKEAKTDNELITRFHNAGWKFEKKEPQKKEPKYEMKRPRESFLQETDYLVFSRQVSQSYRDSWLSDSVIEMKLPLRGEEISEEDQMPWFDFWPIFELTVPEHTVDSVSPGKPTRVRQPGHIELITFSPSSPDWVISDPVKIEVRARLLRNRIGSYLLDPGTMGKAISAILGALFGGRPLSALLQRMKSWLLRQKPRRPAKLTKKFTV